MFSYLLCFWFSRVNKYTNNVDVVNFGRNFSLHANHLGEFREEWIKDYKIIFRKTPREIFFGKLCFYEESPSSFWISSKIVSLNSTFRRFIHHSKARWISVVMTLEQSAKFAVIIYGYVQYIHVFNFVIRDPVKHLWAFRESNQHGQQPPICFSVFDHFMGLVLKALKIKSIIFLS